MSEKLYPIKYVARETGLTPLVIRAWERRYNAVVPQRTDTNRRLYSEGDIMRLKLLARAVDSGINIGAVADKENQRIMEMIQPSAESITTKSITDDNGQENSLASFAVGQTGSQYFQQALDAVTALDGQKLENILMRASVQLSKHAIIEDVIVPLMHKIGDLWEEGQLRIINEHLATAVVRSFLGNMRGAFSVEDTAPVVLVTTPQGQLHELGALLTAAAANEEGWKCTYLGPNIPSEEIIAAAEHLKPRVLSLSLVHPADDPRLPHDLEKMKMFLPKDIRIIVGGRAAEGYAEVIKKINAEYLPDIRAFRRRLQELRYNKH